jgi:hypothetical protein
MVSPPRKGRGWARVLLVAPMIFGGAEGREGLGNGFIYFIYFFVPREDILFGVRAKRGAK